MPKLIVVFEPKQPTDIPNILNAAQDAPELPEGVEVILGTSVVIEFPKAALFLAKLLVAADGRACKYRAFEIATPSEWEFEKKL